MTDKNKLGFETAALDDEASALVIIDQTRLPNERKILRLTTQKEIWDAIYLLQVRGAPAIGVAAAYGIYLAARGIDTTDYDVFVKKFSEARDYLNSARPTAVNLSWALSRMGKIVEAGREDGVAEIKKRLLAEARAIQAEDIEMCRKIGEHGPETRHGPAHALQCRTARNESLRHGDSADVSGARARLRLSHLLRRNAPALARRTADRL